MVGFLEIRVKEVKINKCFYKIVRGWVWENNYQEVISGCIWILWKVDEVDVQVLIKYEQFIYCKFSDKNLEFEILIIFVYGRNVLEDRVRFQVVLKIIYFGVSEVQCICGVFNVVKDINNRMNGKNIIINEIRDFSEFLDLCNIFKMIIMGKKYIWFYGYVFSKIDQVFCF